MITEVQRFSLNDGPGIRTTVFFMGCPLSCKWCHNPESLTFRPRLMAYPTKCIGCGACMRVCPTGARASVFSGDRSSCIQCGACAAVCYTGALVWPGSDVDPDRIMEEILADKPYYLRSSGGVTLSGGECLAQPELSMQLLSMCRAEGIHTAVETCLAVPGSTLARVLPLVDLFMLDLKLADAEKHHLWTGVSNEGILANYRTVTRSGKPYIVRTPVIPGVNDTVEDIAAIARIVASCAGNRLYYELLNYNPLGEGKYAALGLQYAFTGSRPLSRERMEALREIAIGCGVTDVRIG